MLELDCPLCDVAVRVAFDAPALRCEGCAISVEIDAATTERPSILPAAA